jgi:DNA end-binding protein Ku
MAQQLIESLSSDFEPERYHDEYREKVLDLVERKAQGEEIATQPEAPAPAKVPDLMAALEASLAAVKDQGAGGDDGDGDGDEDGKADGKGTSKKRSSRSGSSSKGGGSRKKAAAKG